MNAYGLLSQISTVLLPASLSLRMLFRNNVVFSYSFVCLHVYVFTETSQFCWTYLVLQVIRCKRNRKRRSEEENVHSAVSLLVIDTYPCNSRKLYSDL
uniref:Secreted protein n=1 Tax=Heterorhabditis bacteriophora TaxID=37862 RepID=A0A1I7WHC5_HETBA